MINPSSNNFRIQSPNGRIWDVPESNLDEAVRRGGEIVQKVQSPNGKIWEVPESKMKIAFERGGKLYQEESNHPQSSLETNEPELNSVDRLLQFGQGLTEGIAGIATLGDKFIDAPIESLKGSAKELAGKAVGLVSTSGQEALHQSAQQNFQEAEKLRNRNYFEKIQPTFNEWAGKDITPKDKVGKFINAAGSFATPIPGTGAFGGITTKTIASQGVKESAKRIGSGLSKNTAIGAGGAAAVEGTRDLSITEKGSLANHVEDFVKAVFGMSLADKGLSAVKRSILEKSSKDLEGLIDHSGNFVKEEAFQALEKPTLREKAAGKILSVGAKPNKEVIEFAKKHDIQLPFQVALGGKAHNFAANNFLKSFFTAKVYDDIIINADKDMVNAVKEKLNNVSGEIINGDLASSRTKNFLEAEKESLEKLSNQLQEDAASYLKPTDMVVPKPLIDTISSMIKIPTLNAPVPSGKAKAIGDYILNIGEAFGFLPNKNTLRQYENNPDFLKRVVDETIQSFKKNPNAVPVERLVSQLRATNAKIYDKSTKEIDGLDKLLTGVSKSLRDSIKLTTNKEFSNRFNYADKFFQQEIVDRIRTDMAKSLMNGEIPKEAFSKMSGVPEIRQLEKIIGDSKNGKEIFSSLKRAKLEQILADKIIDSSGTISYANFSNMFLKKSENQALLKELLGDQYQSLRELAKISQEFVKSGRLFGNPSGTSFATRDVEGAVKVLNAVGSILVGGATQGVLGTVEVPLAINMLSRVVSNKKYVDTALKYAESVKNKNPKSQKVLLERLDKIGKSLLEGNYPEASIIFSKNDKDQSSK